MHVPFYVDRTGMGTRYVLEETEEPIRRLVEGHGGPIYLCLIVRDNVNAYV